MLGIDVFTLLVALMFGKIRRIYDDLYWTTQQFTLFCINNPKNQQNYYYPQSVILHRLRLLFSDTCYSYLENTVEIT